MSKVQRWSFLPYSPEKRDDGEYVLFADYERDTTAKICRWTRRKGGGNWVGTECEQTFFLPDAK